MCAKRYSEKFRWRLVVVLEITKALCRTIIMRVTRGRMNVTPPVAEREGVVVSQDSSTDGSPDSENDRQEWKMPRTGLRLSPLPATSSSPDSIYSFLSARVISAEEIKPAARLISRISTYQGQLAELVWILRPVVYTLAMQRLRGNKRDWRPWALGLAMEMAARGLGKKDLKERGWKVTSLERDEWGRRGWGLAWWGMRGAFYEALTRSVFLPSFCAMIRGGTYSADLKVL